MPLCASVPATVDTDLNVHGAYLTDLDKCMKKFNEALTATMNSYRHLLAAFDQVAQVYGNIAQTCSAEVNDPVKEFRDGMRDLKDKGGFEVFNREIHEGTVSVLDPVRQDLKRALKSYKEVRARQKEYDTVRYDLDQTEKKYSKKEKPLSESKGYQKNLVKREKTKEAFESSKAEFGQEVHALQSTTDSVLMQSLNNYLHCTATFCGQLEVTMSGFRTDVDKANGGGDSTENMSNMDKLKEKAKQESSFRRAKREAAAQPQYPGANPDVSNDGDAKDDFYPKKPQRLSAHEAGDNRYPEAEPGPNLNGENPFSLQNQ